jgi:8-amino-7-oxononanoate synthase
MTDTNDFFAKQLEERKKNGLYRSLQNHEQLVDFASNDYLGLARSAIHPSIPTSSKNGATGSRLISGNSPEAEDAERSLANHFGFESALIFNSGYTANIGLLSCLARKEDVFLSDELVHASLIDGMRLTHAKRYKFEHNSLTDLTDKLDRIRKTHTAQLFVVIESVYSMDGDLAPLSSIIELCDRYEAKLIVDEAHAAGVLGAKGMGLVVDLQLQNRVFACVYTFGKAYGLHGAMVAGTNTLREYLINFSRPFIYSTALPPESYLHIKKNVTSSHHIEQQGLLDIIHYFNQQKKELSHLTFLESNTAIQALIIGDNEKAKDIAARLLQEGMYCKAILSPTVPVGTERLRICLHAFNSTEQINQLIHHLKKNT